MAVRLRQEQSETERLGAEMLRRLDDLLLQLKVSEIRRDRAHEWLLEERYARNLGNWLGRWIRAPKPIVVDDLEALAQHVEEGAVSSDEFDDVSRADFILAGRRPVPGGGDDVLAVVEISFTIDPHDIERAARRAAILSRAGYDVVAVVGGYELTADAKERANLLDVRIDLRQLAA
ncbi:MAG: hypothetical protein ACKVT1_13775 [Dehalococcoidia bacterium]